MVARVREVDGVLREEEGELGRRCCETCTRVWVCEAEGLFVDALWVNFVELKWQMCFYEISW